MKIKLVIGLIISGICIAFALHHVNYKDLYETLRSANPIYLVVAIFFILMTMIIRSLRWQFILRSLKATRIINLLSATSIGALADMLLPARTGDLIRAGVIGSKENVSKVSSLATIVTERIFDILTILFILLLIVTFYKLPASSSDTMHAIKSTGWLVFGFCLLVIFILLMLKNRTEIIVIYIDKLLKFVSAKFRKKLTDTVLSFAAGLQAMRFTWRLGIVLLYSFILWSVFALSNFFVLQALDFHFHPATAYYILLFQILGVALPSSPGFIGTYHAAVVAGFSAFDISVEQALSIAILMHAAFFFPFISGGLVFLWRENLSFSDLRTIRK